MQLFSKMRFVSAQFLAYFTDNKLWRNEVLQHANKMAKMLEAESIRHTHKLP
jgi:threonine aldolase